MRLFTGIEVPAEVRATLERLISYLRPAAHLKWCPVYNLHITTKFIGEWPEERLDELNAALGRVPHRAAVAITVRQLGWFPNARNPRVFWAGLEHDGGLSELARATNEVLEPLGIAKETREFAPHLTLARIKEPTPLGNLRSAIEQLETHDFGSFQADTFHLYLSKPGAAGSIYTKLSGFRFAG